MCALRASSEWLVLLFLLWLIQSTSLSGRRTLERCLVMAVPLRMPVELVRGGMALGDAKGCEGDVGDVVDDMAGGARCEVY
jgi:hypothetical protein